MAASSEQSAAELAALDPGRAGGGLLWPGLAKRLVLFVLLFAAEWIPLTHLVHKDRGAGSLLQLAVVCGSLFLAFGYVNARPALRRLSAELEQTPVAWAFLAGHLCAFLGFIGISLIPGSPASGIPSQVIAAAWYITGALAIGLAGIALVPPKLVLQLVRTTGYLWAYALVLGVIAWRLTGAFSLWNGPFWNPLTNLTFRLVRTLLHLFLRQVIANPETMTIGSTTFRIEILPWCSGFEGTALMLAFSATWLYVVRRELRFPRALLLVPAGMVTIWLANAVRITVLILIGNAGAPRVALGGFHSQAGWIAFNVVALGFTVAAGRAPWLRVNRPARLNEVASGANPVAAYLMPFLMVLAAAMISGAMAGGVEWLYPLRFFAAAAALWHYRYKYAALDWRAGWVSPLTGGLVFAIWIGLDRIAGAHGITKMGAALGSLSPTALIAWLVFRIAGAVITVPMAEELAFRGYLLRRLISADFESVSFRQFSILAFAVSSAAFGLMHGSRWFAGTLAGMLYAWVLLRRGRMGDCVVAHATTNALLAMWVLLFGRWDLW
jgi:exosortase E/protease (VPEID-CTERM system)